MPKFRGSGKLNYVAVIVGSMAAMIAVKPVQGCSCLPESPPCQAFWQADSVFVGQVLAVSSMDVTRDGSPDRRAFTFSVERKFKGTPDSPATVRTGVGDADCGYPFRKGQRYLVYAWLDRTIGTLTTSICTRTRPLGNAREDLDYFESLQQGGVASRIFGTVRRLEFDLTAGRAQDLGPIEGIEVTARGNSVVQKGVTNERGRYELSGLPAGNYHLELRIPAGLYPGSAQVQVELPDPRACAEVNFSARSNGRISGRLTEAAGEPAASRQVELISARQLKNVGKDPIAALRVMTDEQGRYQFEGLSPGQYVVGINLESPPDEKQPYPPTFYPGTAGAEDATVLPLKQGEKIELKDFRLLPRLRLVSLTGTVLWPDGQPAPRARVVLADGRAAWRQIGSMVESDEQGRFSFNVLEGWNYLLRAYLIVGHNRDKKQIKSESRKVEAAPGMETLRLVLDR